LRANGNEKNNISTIGISDIGIFAIYINIITIEIACSSHHS